MPSLPSTLPSSSIPSPLVGLGAFVAIVIVVSGICFFGKHIVTKMSMRRWAHAAADAEKAGDASNIVFKGKPDKYSALSILVGVCNELHLQQVCAVTVKACVQLYKRVDWEVQVILKR
ncbi:hypothetical protein B0H17DRAFT_1202161 [Mycena rosella]|uniref:Uncharacterized protein n=1 Tax=Mycena rosella TaxID=1033263 RepID=A0AAD7GGC6_MYCRO|nr:hypothetical protein B0H17DRAFT_1202161 [Mycena rosella]